MRSSTGQKQIPEHVPHHLLSLSNQFGHVSGPPCDVTVIALMRQVVQFPQHSHKPPVAHSVSLDYANAGTYPLPLAHFFLQNGGILAEEHFGNLLIPSITMAICLETIPLLILATTC